MAHKSLKHKAASGMVWTALQRYSTMIIQFISGIILARLLTPFDYGCIGMLSIFMVLAEAFIDGGFGSALIQKKTPTQVDYSTIFFWNIGMALIMYIILYTCAPAIARFYDIPLLSPVLRVQGVILFIYAFNIIQRNRLVKKLNFKVLSIVTITTSIISLTVTITMAYKGFGVWALVTQHIITAAIPAIVFWFYIKWRPTWAFSWKSFRELFGFGLYIFLTNLFNNFGHKIQGLLIGKVYNSSTMGYYSKAESTERLASTSISQVMMQVTFPLYSEVQDDKEKLGNMVKRVTMTLSLVTFPLLFILLLCAKPIFLFLYSDRWLDSVPYFQALCISGLAYCLQGTNLQAISAIGKSKTLFVWTVIKRFVGIGLIVAGLLLFGMKGLLIGVILNSWFSYLINILLVSKHVGYHWLKQIKDLLPVAIASTLTAVAAFGVGQLVHLNTYLDGLLKFSVYVLVYVGWVAVFKPEAYKFFWSIISPRLRSLRNKRSTTA